MSNYFQISRGYPAEIIVTAIPMGNRPLESAMRFSSKNHVAVQLCFGSESVIIDCADAGAMGIDDAALKRLEQEWNRITRKSIP